MIFLFLLFFCVFVCVLCWCWGDGQGACRCWTTGREQSLSFKVKQRVREASEIYLWPQNYLFSTAQHSPVISLWESCVGSGWNISRGFLLCVQVSSIHLHPKRASNYLYIYLFIICLSLRAPARETRGGEHELRKRCRRNLDEWENVFLFSFFRFLSFFLYSNASHRGFLSAPNEDTVDYDRIRTEFHNMRGFSAQKKPDVKPQSDVVRSWRRGEKEGGVVWRSALVCITAAPRLMYFLQSSNSFCVLFCSNMIRSCDDLRELPVKCMICYCCWFVALMFAKVKSNQSS